MGRGKTDREEAGEVYSPRGIALTKDNRIIICDGKLRTIYNSSEFFCFIYLTAYKRASLACAARLADTLRLPEAACGRLESLLINYMGDSISKYVCPTVIIDIARKITK